MFVLIPGAIRIRFSCLSRQLLTASVLFSLSMCFPGITAQADSEFTSDPILRLEIGQHTSIIRGISVDRKQRFLVSASDDKTARVYDIESGRLLKTLRVPIDDGNVGKIYAVAISPDGDTVALGGWTGKTGEDKSIYLMNRNTGTMVKRIGDLPNVINHLAYSPDGHHLAAMLFRRNGIRVYDTRDYREIARDDEYGDSSYWGSFDSYNRLVTTSLDGYIRLYDSDFKLIKKKRTSGGDRPFSAVFSPDGRKIAVGYDKSTSVDVLSADDLSLLYSADTENIDNGDLSTVAWSIDGRYLYAGGLYVVDGWCPILRWDRGGRGEVKEFSIATNKITGMMPLNDGRLAIGTADPLVAVLEDDGKAIWKHHVSIADFRNQRGMNGILLSHTGDVVNFGFKPYGENPARFSFSESKLTLDPPEDNKLVRPITEAKGLDIAGWKDEYTPKLNNTHLELDKYERSRSLAIAPDGKRFLLGAEWSLRCFDCTGKDLWKVDAPGAAWALNISGDGRLGVAGFGDGTLRWYHMEDGKEYLALFPLPDNRWVAWTPEGDYKTSAVGEDLIGWHCNNGADKAPDFYGMSRFPE